MDTEKYVDLEKKIETGQSPNDEGPFYHHAWWESYKGSIKGKLGGTIIGCIMGAIVGGVVAAALATFTGLTAGTIGLVFAGVATAGIMYGAHEFSDIGKIVGSTASALEQADAREAIRFAALEKKIDALAASVGNKIKGKASGDAQLSAEVAQTQKDKHELETYRTTHYAHMEQEGKNHYVFWKVALAGLVVGVLAGLALGVGGAATHIFEALGVTGLHGATATAASAITFGMFGASFGINRDLFRRIFDRSDLLFKGIVFNKKVKEQQIAAGQALEEEIKNGKNGKNGTEKAVEAPLAQGYESAIDYPESNTYHRDKVLAAAEKALLSFDHTRATPH